MGIEHFESYEMMMFGLDPVNEVDAAEWLATAPEEDKPVDDYSQDAFEFGAPDAGQVDTSVVE